MTWIWIALLLLLVLVVLPPIVLTGILYSVLLVRTKPEKWGREISMPDDDEYVKMYADGLAWGEEYGAFRRSVETENDGLRLAGEYFDFGFDRAVILISGRMEGCRYSYYFAEPYRAAGWNVLAIDARAHGQSGGKINRLGYREYRDILAWGRLLHDALGAGKIWLHGVCIGASTALFTLCAPDCPDYFAGMTADGMYTCFGETLRNHMLEQGRPMFPFYPLLLAYIRVVGGADAVHDGPLYRIGRLTRPILFLHSREDRFSLPEKAEELYARCMAPKRLVWFDHGGHSRVRFNNREQYDATVTEFLGEFVGETHVSK